VNSEWPMLYTSTLSKAGGAFSVATIARRSSARPTSPPTYESVANTARPVKSVRRHFPAAAKFSGYGHPTTLAVTSSLADDLRALGEDEQALELDMDTLERYRRIFGNDHASTRAAATKIANARREQQSWSGRNRAAGDNSNHKMARSNSDNPHV
jgi:hypothetical protein